MIGVAKEGLKIFAAMSIDPFWANAAAPNLPHRRAE